MKRVKFDLIVTTNMFSHGYHYGDGGKKKEVEFRIPELKANMRYWWRASHIFKDSKDMYDKESELFGSTTRKSPISFRYSNSVKLKKICNETSKRIEVGTEIPLEMLVENGDNLYEYIEILKLSSILGGLGQGNRKGNGAFHIKIHGAMGKPLLLKEDLKKEINILLEKEKSQSIIDVLKDFRHGFEWKKTDYEREIGNYPYIQKILLGSPTKKEYFNKKIGIALNNSKNLVYNFYKSNEVKRYLKPVHITVYPVGSTDRVFPIITFLNNTSITNEQERKLYNNYLDQFEKIII